MAFLSLLGAKEFERVLYVLEIVAARRIASSDRHIPRQLEDVIPAHRTNAQNNNYSSTVTFYLYNKHPQPPKAQAAKNPWNKRY